jgi:hypothetical protein
MFEKMIEVQIKVIESKISGLDIDFLSEDKVAVSESNSEVVSSSDETGSP